MAQENKTPVSVQEEPEEKAGRVMPKSRRYVGSKETFAYVLYDIAQSLNLDSKATYYVTDVLVIALKWQSIVNGVVGAWDIINDIFLASIVDRTNTRIGKFKPYLILYAGPGTFCAMFFWIMPKIFPGAAAAYTPKIVTYFALSIVRNLVTSLYNIAKTGIIATITPDISDRTRIINQANLFSSLVEKWPQQFATIFIDLVNRNIVKMKMTSLFVYLGAATALISGALGFYFSVVVKERVLQSVEKPSFKNSLTSLFRSRPLLLLALSDFLAQFSSVGTDITLYYTNVLNFSSAELVVGIPGMFVTYASYTYVNKLREKFSTKTLWIVGDHWDNLLMIFVFLFGSINKNYSKTVPMVCAFMARETIWNTVYAMRRVIPVEIGNEVIDYGEWKNGYRTEGMSGVVRGLASKLVGSIGGVIRTLLLQAIGYRQGLKPGQQTAKTAYYLFATCTLLPSAIGLVGIIPKLFYNIDKKTRDRMYAELAERRSAVAKELNSDELGISNSEL